METNENVNGYERPFVKECNNFIDAKYIVVGNNINVLFDEINNDESLLNIVNYCLEDFDFSAKLGVALSLHQAKQKDFIMPKENEEIVALCYGILQRIVDGEIDFESFISKYFLFNGTFNDTYINFGHYFVKPFKNAILNLENKDKYSKKYTSKEEKKVEKEEQEQEEEVVEENETIDRLFDIVQDIEDVILSDIKIRDFKQEELEFYLKAFKEALKINNKLIILALADAIVLSSSKIKSLKYETQRLKSACNEL